MLEMDRRRTIKMIGYYCQSRPRGKFTYLDKTDKKGLWEDGGFCRWTIER